MRPFRGAAAKAAVLVVLVGCAAERPGVSRAPTPEVPPAPTAATAAPAVGTARALLDTLVVRGRGPRTGYDRDLFGQAWYDADRNGCDTRNDVLRRDLREADVREGTGGCLVLSGRLEDPYTGSTVAFERGDGQVEIDHVVALSDAWQKGAAQWGEAKRLAFANDPLNLVATTSRANGSKSDSDAATWLPPSRAAWCPMVARQVAVKSAYALAVTAAEHDAAARVLDACPGECAPIGAAPTEAPLPRR